MIFLKHLRKLLLDSNTYERMNVIEENEAFTPSLAVSNVITKVVLDNTKGATDKNISPTSAANPLHATLGKDTLIDLEVLGSYASDATNTNVVDSLGKRSLMSSRYYLENIIKSPIQDRDTLQTRQNLLKCVHQKYNEQRGHHDTSFKNLEAFEEDIGWLFSDAQLELSSLYDMVYIQYWLLGRLNKNEPLLTSYNLYRIFGSPLLGVLSPVLYFIVPYMVIRYSIGPISFFSYMKLMFNSMFTASHMLLPSKWSKLSYLSYGFSLLFYFQSLYNSVEVGKAVYKLSKLLTNHMNGIIRFIQNSANIVNALWTEGLETAFGQDMGGTIDPKLPMFNDPEYSALKPFSVFTNFGKQLSVFKYLKKTSYIPLFRRVYFLDALCTPLRLLEREHLPYSYTTFITRSDRPTVELEGFFHPCLPPETTVTNSLSMGDKDTPNNIILTGPNAGGKSTLIKSYMISIILSQTLTIANASAATITPFGHINTQINIPDCKGKQSLFEAEMYRSKSNFQVLEAMPPTSFVLIAMDEIFSSTNPIEGIAGAYAIAKKLSEFQNAMCIISTHYVYLTRLASQCKERFSRYRMNVNLDTEGNVVSYPYKLVKGVSRQYVALELLKKNGFDQSIIDEAIRVKERLTVRAPSSITPDIDKSKDERPQQADKEEKPSYIDLD